MTFIDEIEIVIVFIIGEKFFFLRSKAFFPSPRTVTFPS